MGFCWLSQAMTLPRLWRKTSVRLVDFGTNFTSREVETIEITMVGRENWGKTDGFPMGFYPFSIVFPSASTHFPYSFSVDFHGFSTRSWPFQATSSRFGPRGVARIRRHGQHLELRQLQELRIVGGQVGFPDPAHERHQPGNAFEIHPKPSQNHPKHCPKSPNSPLKSLKKCGFACFRSLDSSLRACPKLPMSSAKRLQHQLILSQVVAHLQKVLLLQLLLKNPYRGHLVAI